MVIISLAAKLQINSLISKKRDGKGTLLKKRDVNGAILETRDVKGAI